MWQQVLSNLTHLGPTDGMGRVGGKREKGRKEGESFKERSSTFSLNFSAIGPAVLGGARRITHPHFKGFA